MLNVDENQIGHFVSSCEAAITGLEVRSPPPAVHMSCVTEPQTAPDGQASASVSECVHEGINERQRNRLTYTTI